MLIGSRIEVKEKITTAFMVCFYDHRWFIGVIGRFLLHGRTEVADDKFYPLEMVTMAYV